MSTVKAVTDNHQLSILNGRLDLVINMIFSKSFGYALRGVIYIALSAENSIVHLETMSEHLGIPRFFMGKIMKRLAKEGIVASQKGPAGGFYLKNDTLDRYLVDIYRITDHPEDINQCVLARGECDSERPCKLHHLILPMKTPFHELLYATKISDLLKGDNHELLRSITINKSA